MGCRDRESNCNNHEYVDGKWVRGWGFDFNYTAPERKLIEQFLGKTLDQYNLVYNETTEKWVATPRVSHVFT